jgi:3-phenylpropionate/cinnamic acid dioxygenase small subunit
MRTDMKTEQDPSHRSYVSDARYAELLRGFVDWQRPEKEIEDPHLRDACRALLEREARFLDQGRFDDWLGLYAGECLYWVPATPGGGDPRREVAIAFDDRRRLEDRIYRLRTGYAWSQTPVSRTVRLVSNVEAFSTDSETVHMIRSNFQITEFRTRETRALTGWCGHRVRREAGRWEILVKQVNLIDCDDNLRNPSIVL